MRVFTFSIFAYIWFTAVFALPLPVDKRAPAASLSSLTLEPAEGLSSQPSFEHVARAYLEARGPLTELPRLSQLTNPFKKALVGQFKSGLANSPLSRFRTTRLRARDVPESVDLVPVVV